MRPFPRACLDHHDPLKRFSIFIMTVEFLIEDSQAAFGSKPCGSSTNLAAIALVEFGVALRRILQA